MRDSVPTGAECGKRNENPKTENDRTQLRAGWTTGAREHATAPVAPRSAGLRATRLLPSDVRLACPETDKEDKSKTTNRGNAPPGRTDLRHGKMQRAVSARRWAAGNPIAAVPLADQQTEKKKHPVVHSLCRTSHPACCQTRTIHLPGALAQTGTPPNDSEGSTSRTRHADPTSRLADRSSVRRREQQLMWSPNKKQTDRHPPPLVLWEVVVMLSVTSACWFI